MGSFKIKSFQIQDSSTANMTSLNSSLLYLFIFIMIVIILGCGCVKERERGRGSIECETLSPNSLLT